MEDGGLRRQLCQLRFSIFNLRFEKHIRGEIMIILRFERRVCRWESCRMAPIFIGALAQQKRRPAQDGKVEGANPSRATKFILPT